jgi:hypothetical protein
VSLIQTFDWIIDVFGAFLIITAVRIAVSTEKVHPDENPILNFAKKEVLEIRDFFAINDVAQSISDWGLVTRPTRISRWGMTKPRRPKLHLQLIRRPGVMSGLPPTR